MREANRLSAAKVAKETRPGRYADGLGLYLQVTPAAGEGVSKSWLFRYMLDGRARQMGLGPLHTISLAEAREAARLARQKLIQRIDPLADKQAIADQVRREADARLTFAEAVEKFLDVHLETWRNAKHRQQWKNTLATYAKALNARPVVDIDARLVNEVVQPIWRSKPETASRVRQRVTRIVQWVKDGMPVPAEGAGRRVQHHAALPFAEVGTFMDDLAGREGTAARALAFTVLTAARTGETIGALWPEIDLEAKVWTVPAERMKAGREHQVPLSEAAVALLKALPREEGNEFVFVGPSQGRGLSNMAMTAVLKRMGRDEITVHGFRSTFRDWAGESTNFPRDVVEAALAHTIENKTEAAYRRGTALEKRRKLMEAWARYCASPASERAGNVVVLRNA